MEENKNDDQKIELIAPTTQPSSNPAAVNSQSNSAVTVSPDNSNTPRKSSRGWKIFFIVLALANIITIVFPLLVIASLIQQAKGGAAGTEFIGILLLPLIFLGYLIAAINIITISSFLIRKRPQRRGLLVGLLVIISSVCYLGWVVYTTHQSDEAYRTSMSDMSKEEAISLISSCKVESIAQQGRLVLFTKHEPGSDPYDYRRYANNNDFASLKAAAEKASVQCGPIEVRGQFENEFVTPQDQDVIQPN